ncbi:MAG: hypothetical protein HY784_17295 [Chloroflexi bacterium]|nr:hypothetical protein [Chloroflexota bacterium]
MSFAYPAEGSNVSAGPLQILGQAAATADFDHFLLEYGLSENPEGWGQVIGPNTQPVLETGLLASWDLSSLPDGPLTLRIIVFGKSGGSAEARLHLNVQHPTATPTPTAPPSLTPTATETATPVPSATVTPLPSAALPPSETPTLTAIPLPTDTPAPTAITAPDETPSPPPKGTLTPIPPIGSETQ